MSHGVGCVPQSGQRLALVAHGSRGFFHEVTARALFEVQFPPATRCRRGESFLYCKPRPHIGHFQEGFAIGLALSVPNPAHTLACVCPIEFGCWCHHTSAPKSPDGKREERNSQSIGAPLARRASGSPVVRCRFAFRLLRNKLGLRLPSLISPLF